MAAKSISDNSPAQLVSVADHPASPAPLVVADGTLQTLKWFALIVMALDHINKFGFREQLPFVFELGRSVLPIFALAEQPVGAAFFFFAVAGLVSIGAMGAASGMGDPLRQRVTPGE